jgi:uncharacterized membrane protein YeiB
MRRKRWHARGVGDILDKQSAGSSFRESRWLVRFQIAADFLPLFSLLHAFGTGIAYFLFH